jgi:hypothetical protein
VSSLTLAPLLVEFGVGEPSSGRCKAVRAGSVPAPPCAAAAGARGTAGNARRRGARTRCEPGEEELGRRVMGRSSASASRSMPRADLGIPLHDAGGGGATSMSMAVTTRRLAPASAAEGTRRRAPASAAARTRGRDSGLRREDPQARSRLHRREDLRARLRPPPRCDDSASPRAQPQLRWTAWHRRPAGRSGKIPYLVF